VADTVATNNRVKTADWRARVETKLDALIEETREERAQSRQQLKEHSRRLDEFALAFAELKRAQQTADKALSEVDALKREQRWWTGATTLLAAVAGFFGLRQ
jgi:broad specificity phosphatase PhoE